MSKSYVQLAVVRHIEPKTVTPNPARQAQRAMPAVVTKTGPITVTPGPSR